MSPKRKRATKNLRPIVNQMADRQAIDEKWSLAFAKLALSLRRNT